MICIMCCNDEAETESLCADCHKQQVEDHARIIDIVNQSHTFHCAYHQVWGDGECECWIEGYDPYAWALIKGDNRYMWE